MAERKRSSSKSSAAAKKTTAAKKAPAKKAPAKKTAAAKNQKTKHLSSELKGIILIAVGAFLALAFFTNAAGVVGSFIKTVFTGLFGGASKVFFLYIIWMGVNTFLERHGKKRVGSLLCFSRLWLFRRCLLPFVWSILSGLAKALFLK